MKRPVKWPSVNLAERKTAKQALLLREANQLAETWSNLHLHSSAPSSFALFEPRLWKSSLSFYLLIEMAGASGLVAGSAFFIGLELVFWFGIQFFGGKSSKG